MIYVKKQGGLETKSYNKNSNGIKEGLEEHTKKIARWRFGDDNSVGDFQLSLLKELCLPSHVTEGGTTINTSCSVCFPVHLLGPADLLPLTVRDRQLVQACHGHDYGKDSYDTDFPICDYKYELLSYISKYCLARDPSCLRHYLGLYRVNNTAVPIVCCCRD